MSYRSPQERPGTQHLHAPNRKSNAGSDGTGGPLAGEAGTDKVHTSDHYPHTTSSEKSKGGGSMIEGLEARGYVHNEAGRGTSSPTDATVAADGTRRVITSSE